MKFLIILNLLTLGLLFVATNYGQATAVRSQARLSLVSDIYGRNNLHYVAELGDLSSVKSLIAKSVKQETIDDLLFTKDEDGLLPVDFAIKAAEEDYGENTEQMLIVSYLMEETWGVDGRDNNGWRPIYWAILAGNYQRVKELIDKGARIDGYGHASPPTAFDLAKSMQNKPIINLLERYMAADKN